MLSKDKEELQLPRLRLKLNQKSKKFKVNRSLDRNEDHKSNVAKINIGLLNDDCLREIFQNLSILERPVVAFVCKRWNTVIGSSWTDVKVFCLDDKLLLNCEKILANKKHILKFLTNLISQCGSRLDLLSSNITSYDFDISAFLEATSAYFKNLTTIKLVSNLEDYDLNLELLFKNNTKLSSLSLKNFKISGNCFSHLEPNTIKEFEIVECNIFDSLNFLNFLSNQKAIKKIKIIINSPTETKKIIKALIKSKNDDISDLCLEDYPYDKNSVGLKELLELILRQKCLNKLDINLSHVDKKFINKLIINQSCNLESFSFKVFELTDQFVKRLSDCKNLRHLIIKKISINLLTDSGAFYFSKFRYLETLQIKNIFIDNVLLELSSCKSLKNLDISHCQFTDSGIKALCLLTNLKFLNVSFTDVTSEQLIVLIGSLIMLNELNFQYCQNVSGEFLIRKASELKKFRNDTHSLTFVNNFCNIDVRNLASSSPLIILKNDV